MAQYLKAKASPEDDGSRLDVFLSKYDSEHSRSYWQKRIDAGDVKVNGNICFKHGYKLSESTEIEIFIPEPEEWHISAEDIPLDIIFEDAHIIVINKTAGMPVHPGAGNHSGTLVNALLFHYGDSLSSINGVERPGIVHRLDKDTSGLIAVAKTDKAHRNLSEQFAEKTAKRVYETLVWFNPENREGSIETFIARDKKDRKKMAVRQAGKTAVTNFRVLQNFSFCSHCEVSLETGRTHQIRVHMQYIGKPVFGDDIYGGGKKILNRVPVMDRKFAGHLLNGTPFLLLHARQLDLTHPESGERLSFKVPVPDYFKATIEKLSDREKKLGGFNER